MRTEDLTLDDILECINDLDPVRADETKIVPCVTEDCNGFCMVWQEKKQSYICPKCGRVVKLGVVNDYLKEAANS